MFTFSPSYAVCIQFAHCAQKSKKPEILYGHIIILYSDPFGHFKSAVLVNNGYSIW